jgi:hypothetical protein
MKKTRTAKKRPRSAEDLLPEYRFDYSKARPNRFATRLQLGSRVVVIEPDVAQVFATQDSVNVVLRALIETMPRRNSESPRLESTPWLMLTGTITRVSYASKSLKATSPA